MDLHVLTLMSVSLLEEISWDEAKIMFPKVYKPRLTDNDASFGLNDEGRLLAVFEHSGFTEGYVWHDGSCSWYYKVWL